MCSGEGIFIGQSLTYSGEWKQNNIEGFGELRRINEDFKLQA